MNEFTKGLLVGWFMGIGTAFGIVVILVHL
jgi:hypothetical protein